MKDNFSAHSDAYARYRPVYPDAFFTYLQTLLQGRNNAWDCATGNGQAAQKLAPLFQQVYATDISQAQLNNALPAPNIRYSLHPAEATNFPADFFDLVLVAQAVHWFDFERFYAEVNRTAKPAAPIVIIGYGKLEAAPELDAIINHFYVNIVGPYWDKERRYLDEAYRTIPFPFEEIPPPSFTMRHRWTLAHLTGYLQTWSAVKHYQNKTGNNPLDLITDELQAAWGGEEKRMINFPLLLQIGKINKTA